MKKIIIFLFLISLFGCGNNSYNEVVFPVIPTELKDCKTFNLQNVNGFGITVMRCPNSTTSTNYNEGKIKKTVVVVDGEEYIKK